HIILSPLLSPQGFLIPSTSIITPKGITGRRHTDVAYIISLLAFDGHSEFLYSLLTQITL
ncbi:hypothetical protein ACQP3J_30915, partial [Escherichia coli]